MRIEVTAEDIATGFRGTAIGCPVAHACRRAGLVDPLVVPVGSIHWREGDKFRAVATPDDVRRFAIAFDRGCWVAPFAFDLDIAPATPPTETP